VIFVNSCFSVHTVARLHQKSKVLSVFKHVSSSKTEYAYNKIQGLSQIPSHICHGEVLKILNRKSLLCHRVRVEVWCHSNSSAYLLHLFTKCLLLQVYQAQIPPGLSSETFFPPTLVIGGLADSNHIIDDDILIPLVAVVPFRTAKEAITLVNNSRYGMAASVWTENASLAVEVAHQLQVIYIYI